MTKQCSIRIRKWSVGAWSALLIDNRWEANWQSFGSGSAIVAD